MTDRELIVVDIETTGLDPETASPLEIAAVRVSTGESMRFVPDGSLDAAQGADPMALAVNRYFERRVFDDELSRSGTRDAYRQLFDWLNAATFAGANPRFDSRILERAMIEVTGLGERWHHRLADISAYTAGALSISPVSLPGLDQCCAALGVVNEAPHSALGDATATAECFRRLVPSLAIQGGAA